MKISFTIVCGVTVSLLSLLGGDAAAQEVPARKPIPEVPAAEAGPELVDEVDEVDEVGEKAEAGGEAKSTVPGVEVRKPLSVSRPIQGVGEKADAVGGAGAGAGGVVPEVEVRKPVPELLPLVVPGEKAGGARAAVGLEPGTEVRKPVLADGIDIDDTLFAPAEPGEGMEPGAAAPGGEVDAAALQVAAIPPKDAQVELMQVYEGLRQFDNGIAAAELVLERDPNNREALAGMARLMVETGRTDEALGYADKLLGLDPGPKSQALKAAALLAAARAEEAEALLVELKANHPGPGPFPDETLLGFAKLEMGAKREARAIFEGIQAGGGADAIELDTAIKQLLLMDLDHAVEWRNLEEAQAAVAKLREDYAGEPETSAAEAVEMFLAGGVDEAIARLTALRSEFPRLRLYPFLLELADFSYVAGDFEAAEAAYAEALADRRTRPRAREAAVRNRAQMRIREAGQASVDFGIVDGEEGSLATSALKVRHGIDKNWYFGAEVTRQDINLDAATGVVGEGDRLEGLLVAERGLKHGRYVEGKLGGSDAGLAGAVTIGKRARVYSDAWSVGAAWNERANDSAQLAALDGRQHRISATYQRELNPRTVISAEAIVRRVEVDGDGLGTGAGGDIEVAYRLNEEERRSNLFLAWHSAYTKFNRSGWVPRGAAFDQALVAQLGADQVAAGLIQDEYSRHGVELRHEGQWREALFTRAIAGLYYRADSSELEASGGVGADWFFRDDLRLYFDALYTTGGKAGNRGAGVIEAKVGLAKTF